MKIKPNINRANDANLKIPKIRHKMKKKKFSTTAKIKKQLGQNLLNDSSKIKADSSMPNGENQNVGEKFPKKRKNRHTRSKNTQNIVPSNFPSVLNGSPTTKSKSSQNSTIPAKDVKTENPDVKIKKPKIQNSKKKPKVQNQAEQSPVTPKNTIPAENSTPGHFGSKNPTDMQNSGSKGSKKSKSVRKIKNQNSKARDTSKSEKVQLWIEQNPQILADSGAKTASPLQKPKKKNRKKSKNSALETDDSNEAQPKSTASSTRPKSANLLTHAKSTASPTQPKLAKSSAPKSTNLLTQAKSTASATQPVLAKSSTPKSTNLLTQAKSIASPTQPKSKREKFKNSKESTLRARMLSRLSAARFRYINQELYTWDGKSADLAFAKDPKTFEAYHSGFRQQAKLWPINPIDTIIKSIKKMADSQQKVIADFGCGEAKLALELAQNRVHSFDLVALNDRVTVADNANTNLFSRSVDVAVHCLSLMSSNISAYLREANRVLKVGGILKIAEVESRFENVDKFVDDVAKFNFRLLKKDLTKNLFYFLDFEKTADIGVARKRKLPDLSLLPCMYKKR